MEVFEEEDKPFVDCFSPAAYDFIFPCLVAMSTSILLFISFFAEVLYGQFVNLFTKII